MRAACLRKSPQEGHALKTLLDFVKSLSLAAGGVVRTQGLTFALRTMIADRVIDEIAVAVGAAHHNRQIFFANGAGLELLGQVGVGLVGFGDDNRAARVAVEPVDDAGARGAAELAKLLEVMH